VRSNWVGFGDFQAGDPVMFAGSVARAGCQREFALVDSRLVGRRPANLRPAEAAAQAGWAATRSSCCARWPAHE
jgi:NADPH:quinone reductase-like Zn-dependent oxidoreductase